MPVLVIDTETTGLSPHTGDRMFSYSTCDFRGNTEVYRVDGGRVRQVRNTKKLRRLMNDHSVKKVFHNAKFDLTMIEKHLGERFTEEFPIADTTVLSRLVRSNLPTLRLKDLCYLLFGYPKDDEDDVKRHCGSDQRRYQFVPEAIMDRYQRGDAERTMLLYRAMRQKMKSLPQGVRDMAQIEHRLIWATKEMEYRGMRISPDRCRSLMKDLEGDMGGMLGRLEEIAGRFVNPNGPQAKQFIYEDLKFPVKALTAKTQAPRLAKEDLLELRGQHEAIDLIIKYRSYQRGHAAVQSYLEKADDNDILHPTINTVGAETGRESAENPPLQQVERPGRPTNPFPVPARRCFIPHPGCVMWLVDYSGIELRILVHYSGDPVMTDAFMQGKNPHAIAAEYWYGKAYLRALKRNPALAEVYYTGAKNTNFAIHYGARVPKAAATLNLPLESVRQKWPGYRELFPGAFTLPEKISEQVLRDGYVTTAFGRRIYIPRREHRLGVNYIVQGTAGDIIKIAQVRLHSFLKAETDLEVWQSMPIHDEIIGGYPRSRGMKKLRPLLRDMGEIMTDFPQMNIPMQVEFSIATDCWANKRPIELENIA